jgi:hypothetical protein
LPNLVIRSLPGVPATTDDASLLQRLVPGH